MSPSSLHTRLAHFIANILIAVVLLLLIIPAASASEDNSLLNFQHGDTLPSFALPSLATGKEFSVKTADGKPTVLMFFSVTPPFRGKRSLSLAEEMTKLNKQFDNRVNFLAIFSDDQFQDQAKQYVKEGIISIPVLDDSYRKIYNRYGVFMLPIAIIISPEGKLHAVIPFTYGINEIIANNLKFLLGDFTQEQLKESFVTKQNIVKTKEEKEYIRRVNYGRVMFQRRMFPAAIREFTTALKIVPKPIEALVGIGFVQMTDAKYEEAEKSFLKALELDKDNDEAVAGYGLVLYRKGAIDKALPHLENALISQEQNVDVIIALGEIYEQRGDISKAMRLNKLAVKRLMQDFE